MNKMVYNKLIVLPTICYMQLLHQNCGTITTTEVTDETNSSKIIKNNNQIPSIFYKHLKNVNWKIRNKILQNYLTLSKNMADPCLISSKVGNNFVALIKDDLLENLCHVIELNPGFGILTESLLKAGVPFINLYEKYNEFYPELHNLSEKYPNRVNIKRVNLLKMSKILNLCSTSESDTGLGELMDNVIQRNWEDKSCMQIIGTTTKVMFIRHLIISVVFQTGFMMYGRPIFYLALPPSILNVSTSTMK